MVWKFYDKLIKCNTQTLEQTFLKLDVNEIYLEVHHCTRTQRSMLKIFFLPIICGDDIVTNVDELRFNV